MTPGQHLVPKKGKNERAESQSSSASSDSESLSESSSDTEEDEEKRAQRLSVLEEQVFHSIFIYTFVVCLLSLSLLIMAILLLIS